MAIQSMTGFGRYEAECKTGDYKIELKSVNNRYFEVQFRIPRAFSALEQKMKKLLSEKLHRGSLYLNIHWEAPANEVAIIYDSDLAGKYISIFRDIQKNFNLAGEPQIADLSHFYREIMSQELAEFDDEALWADLFPVLEKTIELHLTEREREGSFTINELTTVLDTIETNLENVEALAPARLERFKERLKQAVSDLRESGVEEARLTFEVTVMAEKLDIAEEITRLKAHIIAMRDLFASSEEMGKRMNFLLQEMNRECNTIGSKANDSDIANLVVLLKEGVEKLREQSLNLV